nr:hypothetical protein [Halorubrum sp. AJ67]
MSDDDDATGGSDGDEGIADGEGTDDDESARDRGPYQSWEGKAHRG